MNHVKKMVLISLDVLRRLNTPTRDNNMLDLESDMHGVLHNPELEDRTKWTQYQQLMQRNQFFQDELRKPAEIPIIEQPVSTSHRFEEEILGALPKVYKTKGELLFKRLCGSEVVTWDKNGKVSINGAAIEESNIVDLVCDAVRLKKSGGAVGWKPFTEALCQINVPQELIGNIQRRHQDTSPAPRPTFPSASARRRRTITPARPKKRRSQTWSHM